MELHDTFNHVVVFLCGERYTNEVIYQLVIYAFQHGRECNHSERHIILFVCMIVKMNPFDFLTCWRLLTVDYLDLHHCS